MEIRRFFLIPTRDQWNKWSIPSKITFLGFYFAIFVFGISLIWRMCDEPTLHEKTIAYYQNAQNHFKERSFDEAIIELRKALDIEPNHVESVELFADILIREKKGYQEAKNELIDIKDKLSSKGKLMLMVLYYNDGDLDKSYEMSKQINPQKVEIYWAQFYYVVKCNVLVKRNEMQALKSFIASSVSELNQRILGLHPKQVHDNPYVQMQDSGPLVPIDYLCASSARFALAGFSATSFENNDTTKIKNIMASIAEYGVGISANGNYAVTPTMAIAFLKTILTNYNSSRTLNWSDIKLTYKWLKQICAALEGKIVFKLPGTKGEGLTITFNSGAKSDEINFVKSTIDAFKEHYKLDDNGDRINTESYHLSK